MGVTGFTGLAYDNVLGIYFAHFRMYDHEAMRFIAVDPIRGNILNPQSINPYLYVLNSPTNFIDPWGLSPTIPVRATAEAAGAEVSWNQDTRTATVSMNGLTMDFVDGQGGSFVNDAWRMQVDSGALNAFLSAAGSAGSSSAAFPPNFWGDLVGEIAAHNSGMSSADIHAIARDMVSFLASNPGMFEMMALHELTPSTPQPLAQVVVSLFGMSGARDDLFVPPRGGIRINATTAQARTILDDLRRLTNDRLVKTRSGHNTYQVSIAEKLDGNLRAGTALIRYLIDHSFTTTIRHIDGRPHVVPAIPRNPFLPDNARNGVGTWPYVYHNPNFTYYALLSFSNYSIVNLMSDNNPSFINLGHELVHALGYVRGDIRSGTTSHTFINQYGVRVTHYRLTEELLTTGVIFPQRRVDGISVSENALRREHRLPLRVTW